MLLFTLMTYCVDLLPLHTKKPALEDRIFPLFCFIIIMNPGRQVRGPRVSGFRLFPQQFGHGPKIIALRPES